MFLLLSHQVLELVTISYYNPFLFKIARLDPVYCNRGPLYLSVDVIEWNLVEKGAMYQEL